MAKQTFTTGQVLTAAQVNSLQANDFNQTVSVKTANYTLVAADKGTRIEFNTSGSVTCTVNTGIFDAGDTLIVQNRGAGAVTVTAGTATVDTSATLVLSQYDSGTLYFVSASASIFFNSDAAATPLTTKGDLFTYGSSDTRLAVGNNGETLVADSSATTGLRWQGNFAAGKNKIINGDFRIWQRGTSFSGGNTYTSDRWYVATAGSPTSMTTSQQTFTPGTAPVSGYEGQFFFRNTITTVGSMTACDIYQSIEDVRTFAGQTVTISFWAKADSTRNAIGYVAQVFGSGGSSTVDVNPSGNTFSVTTSWQRFSYTLTIPSISGKTIGTNSLLRIQFRQANAAGSVLDLWGVQVEASDTATAFQTATGSLGGELALCQRYYWRENTASNSPTYACSYAANSATISGNNPVVMRAAPSVNTTMTNANYGTAWNLAQPTRTTCTKTGTVSTNFFSTTQSWAITYDGGTFSPDPTSFQGVAGQYIEGSAEL